MGHLRRSVGSEKTGENGCRSENAGECGGGGDIQAVEKHFVGPLPDCKKKLSEGEAHILLSTDGNV